MLRWIDRIVLWRSGPIHSSQVAKNLHVIETQNPKLPIALKFKYAGNTQYHQLSNTEADALITELNSIRNKGSN